MNRLEEKKISVIIPLYNQLKFFKKCIESVSVQSYKNLEIICVDDGSNDGVESYLDQLAGLDERIIAIHQQNKGESNARNVALQESTGDYIAFVDCDDWIDRDMYKTLMDEAIKNDLDVVASSWYKEEEDKTIEVRNELQVRQDVFDRNQFLTYLYMRDSYRGFSYMWNKLYKRESLLHGGGIIKFDESLSLGGDVVYLAQIALNSKRIKYIDKAFYHYRIRQGSGSHTTDTTKMRDWIKAYEITIDLFKRENVSVNTIDYVIRFMAYHAWEGAAIAKENNESEALMYFQQVMKENEVIYCRLNASHPERIKQYKEMIDLEG